MGSFKKGKVRKYVTISVVGIMLIAFTAYVLTNMFRGNNLTGAVVADLGGAPGDDAPVPDTTTPPAEDTAGTDAADEGGAAAEPAEAPAPAAPAPSTTPLRRLFSPNRGGGGGGGAPPIVDVGGY